jgi:glycosyltransferase involved in cell wall biosynthesis
VAKIIYDARWIGQHGIGRFADEVLKRIPSLEPFYAERRPSHPLDPVLLGVQLSWLKPELFFSPGYNSPAFYRGDFAFSLHDLHHLCVSANSNAAKRAFYNYYIRPACHRAAAVFTVSEYSKREISAWAGVSEGKIINVGNGVGEPFVLSGPRHEPGYPYFLYVGSHKPHKNLDRLLDAYARSGVTGDVRLIISGPPEPSMLRQADRLGVREKVKFIDSASHEDIARLYRGALAFAFPSLYEGFGLPPIEAMACGTVVVSSNVCAIPEVLGDAALLVNPLDVEAIAEGLKRVAEDSTLREELKRKGLRRAKMFTWEETARKISKVLHIA